MIQILEQTENSATVSDGRATVEVVTLPGIKQVWISVNGARFPRIFQSIESAIAGYKQRNIKEMLNLLLTLS